MAKRIVDVLEQVKVDEVARNDLTLFSASDGIFESLIEQRPVGQARQCIVQGHVGDLRLGSALLGNVLVRSDHSAVVHTLH